MSLIIDDPDHEISIESELIEIKKQLQVMNMILREAFQIDLQTIDIEDEQ